jgi:hypothetical protein
MRKQSDICNAKLPEFWSYVALWIAIDVAERRLSRLLVPYPGPCLFEPCASCSSSRHSLLPYSNTPRGSFELRGVAFSRETRRVSLPSLEQHWLRQMKQAVA